MTKRTAPRTWREAIAPYQNPQLLRSVWQLCNTLLPYLVLWALLIWSLHVSYWLTLALTVPAAGFLVRIFIIFHDCTHGSFFKSPRANDIVGFITGVLTFTPYAHWRYDHAMHHATSGDLDRRGFGDVWTMTVSEYLQASWWKRFVYRLARNPVVLFGILPPLLFLVRHRVALRYAGKRERASVRLTNFAVIAMAGAMSFAFGWKSYLLIQLPVLVLASGAGVWLFYVQHQFEGVYWERHEHWDFEAQALEGSSYYKLPKVLQWFTGSIGFHHVHHLSPRIPNYHLERCHKAEPIFQKVKTLTLFSSLRSMQFRLWDERKRRLIDSRELRALRRSLAASS